MKSKSFLLTVTAAVLCVPVLFGACAAPAAPSVSKAPEATDCPEPTATPEPQPHDVELYQLAPEDQSLLMSYVIRTPMDKIIVIDGGIAGYGKEAPPYMPAAIRAILGLGQNDYFEVEAWF